MFVEFYGLPGSGKSTLSHKVAERLRREGCTVEEPSFDIDHEGVVMKRGKKMVVGVYWFLSHPAKYRRVSEIVRSNGYKGATAFRQTVNVIQKMRIYNKPHREKIVLWDQGLLQACISLSTTGIIKASENYEKLLPLMPPAASAARIYIDADDETVLDRISKRASNNSRLEKQKDSDSRHEMLKRIRFEISTLREAAKSKDLLLVTSNNIEEDTERIYNAILNIL